MVTSSKRTYALSTPETLSLRQTTADPYLHRRCSNTVCLSLYRVPGSWCAQGLFEPSERLWQGQGLILNVNHPSYHLTGAFPLPLDMGCLLTVAPVCTILLGFFWPWTWGISSRVLQWCTGATHDLGHGVSPHICCSWLWTWGIFSQLLNTILNTIKINF